MSVFKPNSHHLWEVLIVYFHLKKIVADAHRIVTSNVTQVLKLFEEQFKKIVFESRAFTLITQQQNFIDLTVRKNEKFLSKPRVVIKN